MIVDHLNTFVSGGAAVAARRLHHALLAQGVQSRFWHARRSQPIENDPTCGPLHWRGEIPFSLASSWATLLTQLRRWSSRRELKRALRGRGEGLEIFTTPTRFPPTPYDAGAPQSDLLHLHWVANFLDYPSFFASIQGDFPIVWTLHDMNPFTGGCHYSLGCEAFTAQCGHCPQLGRRGAGDLSERGLKTKQDALRGKNVHVVAPSRWLEHEARRSQVFAGARSIRTIHHGLDVTTFSPIEKSAARRRFGLAPDRVVVGFGAQALDHPLKGFRELRQALARLPSPKGIVCLVFGKSDVSAWEPSLPELRSVGFIGDQSRLAEVYSAMDLFVLPSLAEALGQTGIEALACQTPVVAFKTGGITDFVRPLETGLLAEPGDSADLARQIQWLVERPLEQRRMGENGRKLVAAEFHQEIQARQYVALYRSLLADRATAQRKEAA